MIEDRIPSHGKWLILAAIGNARDALRSKDMAHRAMLEAAKAQFLDGWSARKAPAGGITYLKLSRREVVRALEAFDIAVRVRCTSKTDPYRLWARGAAPAVLVVRPEPHDTRPSEGG